MNAAKKIIVGILLVSFFLPQVVLAQLERVPTSDPYTPYIGNDKDLDTSALGSIGSALGSALGDTGALLKKLSEEINKKMNELRANVCIVGKAVDALNVAEKVDQWSFGGLKLLTGPIGESAMIKGKITALEGARACFDADIKKLKDLKPATLMQGQTKQALLDEKTKQKNTVDLRLDELNAQYRIAQRGFWKGIMIATLLKTTKVVSQRLVNSLTSRYKVNDVMQYADAVASNVYTAQLINDRAVDNEEQLILRSMISNPLLRTKVDNVIYQKAADALELNGQVFSARTTSADDPDFYLKMLKYGDANSHVPFLKTAYDNRASEIQSAGLSSAQNEILLGSGLKAPRTCEGNVNEQKAIDQKWAQANDKLGNRAALYQDLKNSYDTQYKSLNAKEQKQLSDDLKKAETDYLKAANELKAMPTSYQTTVLKICKAIASPAELVNKGIDKAFGKFADTLGDYNDNNLPFFMGWISDIGSAIGSNLIFGGDLKSTLLAESGNLTSAINLGLSFADANAGNKKKNLENGIVFDVDKGSGADEYVLSWDVMDVKNAVSVTINGDGISDVKRDAQGRVITERVGIGATASEVPALNRLPLAGDASIKTKKGGNYTLKVYDSSDRPLANTGTVTIDVSAGANSSGSGSGTGANPPATYDYTSYNDCVAKTDKAYCDANPSLYPPAPKYDYASKADCIAKTDPAYCEANPSLYPPAGGVQGAFVKKPAESLRGYKTEILR